MLEEVEFFHCFSEGREFLVDLVYDGVFLFHCVFLRVFVCWRVFIVSWLTTQPFSVTEEKGEGFENGKKSYWRCGLPSTSDLQHILRLKSHVYYKKFVKPENISKLRMMLAYGQYAFQYLLFRNIQLSGKPCFQQCRILRKRAAVGYYLVILHRINLK